MCKRNKLRAAFTTSSDIIGAGLCSSYWLYRNNKWIKVKKVGYSRVIFDKFSPVTTTARHLRNLLFSSRTVKPFNNPYIFNLFFDKQKAYTKLSQFSIPTVTIHDSTQKSIHEACSRLSSMLDRHLYKDDFSDEIVMKDRFGAGGLNVYKFKRGQQKQMGTSMKNSASINYIIQPFAKFDRGFRYRNLPVSTDIRLIYLGGKIIQTYIRMAKSGEFRCNEHQGGRLKYIPQKNIPQTVVDISDAISRKLHKNSLYSLDFIITNNGNIFLLEGNTGPGLDWNLTMKENEREAQKLIRIVVKRLGVLVAKSRTRIQKARNYSMEFPTIEDQNISLVPLIA